MEKSSVLTLSHMQLCESREGWGNSWKLRRSIFITYVSNPWFKLQEVLTLLYDNGRIRT